jgi:hypothetical protein
MNDFPSLFCAADVEVQADVIDILCGPNASPSLCLLLEAYELAPEHTKKAALLALGVSL